MLRRLFLEFANRDRGAARPEVAPASNQPGPSIGVPRANLAMRREPFQANAVEYAQSQ